MADEVIARIVDQHKQAWARQNRFVGEEGDVWIVAGRFRRNEFRVYWTYLEDDVIALLGLLDV